ncbi:MAG: hypothetical protein ABI759_10920 [Candidatus Solibacter sp.]
MNADATETPSRLNVRPETQASRRPMPNALPLCDTSNVGAAEGSSKTPQIAYCETRQRLLQSVAVGVTELVALQNEHLKAIISGDPDFQVHEDRIRKATAIKDERKRAFMAHIEEHGC